MTRPCTYFDDGSVKSPLKLGDGWVITSHCLVWMKLLIHVLNSLEALCKSHAIVWSHQWDFLYWQDDTCELFSGYTLEPFFQVTKMTFKGRYLLRRHSKDKTRNIAHLEEKNVHYNDVMMSAMTSQITNLTIVYPTVYSGADQENIKAPRFTGNRWIPRTKGQQRGKCFHLMTSSCFGITS